MLRKKYIFGVGITDETQENILKYILQGLKKSGEKYYVVTPNPEILVYAKNHQDFKAILNNARLALPDGVGVIWAGKILGKKFSEKGTGTDLLEKLCSGVARQPITVGFLGGRDKIAEMTAECLVSKYPGLKVSFVGSEWKEEGFRVLNPKLEAGNLKLERNKNLPSNFKLQKSNLQHPVSSLKSIDLLFVAYGFPKQEEWMSKNLSKLPVKVAIGVGGAFDYISGNVPRAPVSIRKIGFEWLFRLIVQPWRIKRQLALLEFVWLVFKERISRS